MASVPIRAMIVEDQALYRELLKTSLRNVDVIDVVGAWDSGQAALADFEQYQPDVVLMDIDSYIPR